MYALWRLLAWNPKHLRFLVVSFPSRGNVHYGDVSNDGLLETEWLQRHALCRGDQDVLWLRGKGRKRAQESKWGHPVIQGKFAFKQGEQAPEEVSSDHTLCIMCYMKETMDKQLKLGSWSKKRKVEWIFDVKWHVDLDPAFDSRAKTTHLEYQLILFMGLLGLAVLGFLQCVVQLAYSGPHC